MTRNVYVTRVHYSTEARLLKYHFKGNMGLSLQLYRQVLVDMLLAGVINLVHISRRKSLVRTQIRASVSYLTFVFNAKSYGLVV